MTGLVACDDNIFTDSETQSLVFIAGYVGHKLVNNKVSFVKVSLSVTEHCSMILVRMSLCIFSKLIVDD